MEKDWQVVKEGPKHPIDVIVSDLKPTPFLKEGERFIFRNTLEARAEDMEANFGIHTAWFVLIRQVWIPENYREHQLVFPATILLDPSRGHLTPFLYWEEKKWLMGFNPLCYRWNDNYRVMRLHMPANF